MILVGAAVIVILVFATVVFIAVYGWLLDYLERRGP
jgi:preprotein translocase subunit SecE